jgi:hypothetical protein
MTTTTEEILVSKLAVIQAPSGLLEKLSAQINRWFHIEAHPVWLMSYDVLVRVNENVHPEWVELFKSLAEDPPDYEGAFESMKSLRSIRNDYVEKHGFKAKLTTLDGQRVIS